MNRFLLAEYLNDIGDHSTDDIGVEVVLLFALPCILGAVLFLVAAVHALKAAWKWEQSAVSLPI